MNKQATQVKQNKGPSPPGKKKARQRPAKQAGGDSRVVNAPVASTRILRLGNPVISERNKNGDVLVTHREYLMDIVGSQAFNNNQVSINPGLQGSFPWLSSMAALYESYKFEKLKFEFQTEASTSLVGTVMAAVDYDASDPPPPTKQAMAAYQGYVRSAPWKDFDQISTKENLSKQKTFYVRTGSLAANQDIKLYDVGNFFLSTQGQADSTTTVGELYVCYTVRLMTPQLNNDGVGFTKSSKITSTTTSNTPTAGSNAPLVLTGFSNAAQTFTATNPYSCLIVMRGSVSTGSPAPVTTGSTCTIVNATNFVNTVNNVYTAELTFLPGQSFIYNLGATGVGNVALFGQYNTPLLN